RQYQGHCSLELRGAGDPDLCRRIRCLHSHFSVSADIQFGVTDQVMKELTITDDRRSAQELARRYRCEFVELSGTDLDLELFHSVQADLMFRYNFVPLRYQGESLVVAMADPSDLVVIDEVSALLGRDLIIQVAPLSEIQDLLKKSESSQRMLKEATEGFKLQLLREDES